MKRKHCKAFAFGLTFYFLLTGITPALASFGDSCCRHHTYRASQQVHHSGQLPLMTYNCRCGGHKTYSTCSDRTVSHASHRSHVTIKKMDSMTQMLSHLFEEPIFRLGMPGARSTCCDIEKMPLSSPHEVPLFLPPTRCEKPFVVAVSYTREVSGGVGGYSPQSPLISRVLVGAALTPIYLENRAFLI